MAERIVNSVNGVTPAVARKIATYVFGKKFIRMVENSTEHTFDFFLEYTVTDEEIKRFKNFWGNSFVVYRVKSELIQA